MIKEKWEAMSPERQKTLQIIAGILLAVISIVFLYDPIPYTGGLFNLSSVIAIVVVLFVPRILETQTGAHLPLLRKVMLIALIIGIVLIALDMFVFKIFSKS
ncbi:MAG: hypothetical protein ACYCX2_02710 [Christensenellales bacterium]